MHKSCSFCLCINPSQTATHNSASGQHYLFQRMFPCFSLLKQKCVLYLNITLSDNTFWQTKFFKNFENHNQYTWYVRTHINYMTYLSLNCTLVTQLTDLIWFCTASLKTCQSCLIATASGSTQPYAFASYKHNI